MAKKEMAKFKADAVKLVTEGKLSVPDAAARVAVEEAELAQWVEEETNRDLERQIRELEKEHERLLQEVAILKKAKEYFEKGR